MINNNAAAIFYYFYPQIKKNDNIIPDIESGLADHTESDKNYLEPFRITSEDVLVGDKNNMVPPAEAPGTAAGDHTKFMSRQRHVLEEKYDDRNGRTVTPVGTIIHNIIKRAEPQEGLSSILDKSTMENVELVMQSGNQAASYLRRTHTKMGRAILQTTITRPTTDVVEVTQKQAVIHLLVQKTGVLAELQTHLQTLGKAEKALLSCWDREVQLPGCMTKLYWQIHPWINNTLNTSSAALDAYGIPSLTKRVGELAIQSLVGVVFPIFAATELYQVFSGEESPEVLHAFANRFMSGTALGSVGAAALVMNRPLLNAALSTAGGAFAQIALPSSWNWLKADCEMFPLMREVLSSIGDYCDALKEIRDLLEAHNLMDQFPALQKFLDQENSSNAIGSLLKSLNSCSFKEGACYRIGELLQVWELLHSSSEVKQKKTKKVEADVPPSTEPKVEDLDALEDIEEEEVQKEASKQEEEPKKAKPKAPPASGDIIRKEMEAVLLEMGKLDMLASCATLVNGSENHDAKFCLVNFINTDNNSIEAKGLWNPMIARRRATVNDLTLCGQGITLTAANGNGKSFLGKGLMLAAVLALSVGIAPAEEFTLTPFAYIGTSANIKDSADGKISGHEKQSQRIGEIKKAVWNVIGKGGRTLTFIDEPYIHTNLEEGSQLVKQAAKDLLIDGNTNVIVTHMREVAQELAHNNSYTPYQLKNRKLLPGVSTESNAIKVAANYGIVVQKQDK